MGLVALAAEMPGCGHSMTCRPDGVEVPTPGGRQG